MASQRKNLAAFTIIIGVLTLILTVSTLAEKSYEGHLPERNDRGTAEAIISSDTLAVILTLLSAVSGSAGIQDRHRGNTGSTTIFGQSCCPAMAPHFPM
jgi:hypothetical protein